MLLLLLFLLIAFSWFFVLIISISLTPKWCCCCFCCWWWRRSYYSYRGVFRYSSWANISLSIRKRKRERIKSSLPLNGFSQKPKCIDQALVASAYHCKQANSLHLILSLSGARTIEILHCPYCLKLKAIWIWIPNLFKFSKSVWINYQLRFFLCWLHSAAATATAAVSLEVI